MTEKFAGCALALLLSVQVTQAQACLQPIPPFVPINPVDIREYSDLLRRDMEAYFNDVERYFRCQDQQRREVFEQTRQVGDDYGRVLEILDGDR